MLQREKKGLEEFLFVEDKHTLLPQLKMSRAHLSHMNHEPWSHPSERGANPELAYEIVSR